MKFRINELTEFPEDIIFSFSPESTKERLIHDSHRIKDVLYIESMQYVDLLDAYLYAQNVVLPEIRTSGLEHISAECWENYIKNIHQRIARHLLAHEFDVSGAYSMIPVWRWHKGTFVYFAISDFLQVCKKPSRRDKEIFCQELAAQSGYLNSDITAFMGLVFDPKLKQPSFNAFMIDLLYRYHDNQLTGAQKEIIEKLAKPGSKPEDVPVMMRHYAETLQGAIQTIDKDDPRALSRFLASQFYGLTHIHPFTNCNGRTATCLINILLRALDHPAIVLRAPNDRAEDGAYAQAMSVIDSDLTPFEEHIFSRLDGRTTEEGSEKDRQAKNLIHERIETSLLYKKIWAIDSDFDADTFQNAKARDFERDHQHDRIFENASILGSHLTTHGFDYELLSILRTIDLFKYIRKELMLEIPRRERLKSPVSGAAVTSVSLMSLMTASQLLNPSQQQRLLETLRALCTGEGEWKLYQKGTVALYQSKLQSEVKTMADTLKRTAACDVEVTVLAKDKSMHVLKVTGINFEKLTSHTVPVSYPGCAVGGLK